MKLEINGRTFQVSFELNSGTPFFTLTDGTVSTTHKLAYISNWLVLRSIAKKFQLTEQDIAKVRNDLIWKIIAEYQNWYKRKLGK